MFYPLSALLAPTFAECVAVWVAEGDAIGAPFPGEDVAREAYAESAFLRDAVDSGIVEVQEVD